MRILYSLIAAVVVMAGTVEPVRARDASPLQVAADRVFRAWDEGSIELNGYRRDLALEALLRLSMTGSADEYREGVLAAVSRGGPTPGQRISYRAQPFNVLTFELYRSTGDRRWLAGFVDESRRYWDEIPRTAEGAMTHPRGERRGGGYAMLIDALQDYASRMAKAGWISGEQEFFEEAVRQFRIYRGVLRDPKTGLWSQGRGWLPDQPDALSPGAWSRGHGWLIRGMVETLRYLPEDSAQAAELRGYLEELATSLLAVQQPNGMWHALLHRPASDSPAEFSGTALIAGYLAIAVAERMLRGQQFEAAARKAFEVLPKYVGEEGIIRSVSPGPGPLMEEGPWMADAFPPGDEHGPFALFFAAVGERLLDQSGTSSIDAERDGASR